MKYDINFTKNFALRFILEDSNFVFTKEDKVLDSRTFFISAPFNICYQRTHYNDREIVTHLVAMEILFVKFGVQVIKKY